MAVLSIAKMKHLSQDHLDDLFRHSSAGRIPQGDSAGTAIIAPGTPLSDTIAWLIHLLAWQGKVFDPDKGELRNKITPFGVRAIVAKVYKDTSWFDGRECIVLDYSRTSLLAHWIRDEIREIAPGRYLGIVFWGRVKLINFALTFRAPRRAG
jgi:hypothetical protein